MSNAVSTGHSAQGTPDDLGFDPDELREKYRRERDRRVRPEGESQYLETTGKFAHYATVDPWARQAIPRDPLTDQIDVAIIGGGFSGMLTAARLGEVGMASIRIIEAGADFGGTWYWNRYPGAQCDIESYCYLPLLEETGYIPKEKYSLAPEIYQHSQRIGKNYGLYDKACFQTRVTSLQWDEQLKRWIIRTNRDDAMQARFVVVATGPISRPKLPDIPGMLAFEGHTFHTSRWDYEYTGGDHNGNLHKLVDKRLAIIGTGASAIQCVPHVGAHAEKLYVFQRTPSSVDARGNKPTDQEWAKSLKPGWQRARRENFNDIMMGKPYDVDLVNDAWTEIFRNVQGVISFTGVERQGDPEELAKIAELADFKKMNQVRSRVDDIVKDPQIAELLKPWYRQFCKRPTFNDDYLHTFNRPNVTLLDTSGTRGVERITKNGIVANNVEYEVDCIIYATGFEFGTSPRRRMDFDSIGEKGQSLSDYWSHGVRTLHGHSSRGFPNWFFVGIGQNGLSVNQTAMFDDQARHVAYIIREVLARGARSVQPTEEAQEAWVEEIRSQAGFNREFLESCTPGSYNSEGKFSEAVGALISDTYAPGANAFNDLLAEWRDKGDLEGLELGA